MYAQANKSQANKQKRQLLSAVIILMLVLSLIAPTMVDADPAVGEKSTGSLKITKKSDKPGDNGEKKVLSGAAFTLYKVMNLKPKASPKIGYEYEIMDDFKTVLAGVTPDDLGNYSAKEIEDLANEILVAASTTSDTQITDRTGVATFDNLSLGYYLVVETKAPTGYIAGKPFFIAIPSTDNYGTEKDDKTAGTKWEYDVEAIPKNEELYIDKGIVSGGALVEENTASVGDTINYVVESRIPNYDDAYFADPSKTPIFKISDEMTNGLTFTYPTGFEKVVTGSGVALNNPADYTLAAGTNGFVLTFTKDFLKDNRGATVKLYYSAVLNKNAEKGVGESNDNNVELEYSNNPKDFSEKGTVENETKVYTFGIKIKKFGEENNLLSGAAFRLYSNAACTTEVFSTLGALVSDANGMITFPSVKEGTYYLKETQSPKGYTLLTNPIKVEIVALKDNDGKLTGGFDLYIDDEKITETADGFKTFIEQAKGDSTVAVKNHEGFSLPETGGMGIYIFLAIGLIGIIAVSIAMTRKKPSKKATV